MNEKDLSTLTVLTTALVLIPKHYKQLISDVERLSSSSEMKDALLALRSAYDSVGISDQSANLVIEKLLEDPTAPKQSAARALSWAIKVYDSKHL